MNTSIINNSKQITIEYALLNVPRIIYLIEKKQLSIVKNSSRESAPTFTIYSNKYLEERWVFIESDFIRIKKIASLVDVSLFPSDPLNVILDRIKAVIKVKWFL